MLRLIKILLRSTLNPVTFISILGPTLALQFLYNYNKILPNIPNTNLLYNPIIAGIRDFQIQAYTVILAYAIALILFLKSLFKDLSINKRADFIKYVNSSTRIMMFYFTSTLILMIGFIIFLFLMNSASTVMQYINYTQEVKVVKYKFPPIYSPLTLYRVLAALYGMVLEYYDYKFKK